jgi:hypothetical protein
MSCREICDALTSSLRTCNFVADLVLVSNHHIPLACHSHNVPSTSNTIPFNLGRFSSSFLWAGLSGANRRGRTDRAMELKAHTAFAGRAIVLGLSIGVFTMRLMWFNG